MWGWSNSGVWLCSTCRYAVLDFAMPYNLDKACPNCSELTRLRARIEELEHLSETYRLAHNDSEEQRVAQNLDLRDRAEKAEQRVKELERSIRDVHNRFQEFPGDDQESDLFWSAIGEMFVALDAAEGE